MGSPLPAGTKLDRFEILSQLGAGSENKQLTSDGDPKMGPTVSPDGKFIFFTSMRSGVPHIWRVNSDGSNPKQITSGDFADFDATCTPDGQWITYVSLRSGTACLWKVGVDGGDAVQLTYKPSERAFFSPDGASLACGYFVEGAAKPSKLAIMPIAGGEPSKLLDLPQRGLGGVQRGLGGVSWAPDGRAIVYSLTQKNVTNLWSQPLDGGKPTQMTNFTSERIPDLAISADGKRIALCRGHSTIDVVLIKDDR